FRSNANTHAANSARIWSAKVGSVAKPAARLTPSKYSQPTETGLAFSNAASTRAPASTARNNSVVLSEALSAEREDSTRIGDMVSNPATPSAPTEPTNGRASQVKAISPAPASAEISR